jgi:rhodanese-related sulfurtransferase
MLGESPAVPRLSLSGSAMAPSSSRDYAGDIDAAAAWALLERDPKAQLIDVRTLAEWNFVGLPDLGPLGRKVHCVEWQQFPSMAPNPNFVGEASAALGGTKEIPVLFLCRSGARSRAAAIALTQAGFSQAFNIAGGFEGDLDEARHRGAVNGWKAAGLPWKQT